jgi:galactokinase
MAALSAFERTDARTLGELAADSQRDADLLLGNQVPATSALATSARTLGAFAASNFGAGFGGAVWALIDAGEADAFARKWHTRAFVAGAALPLTDLSSS